jgi:hypothetical protein
MTVAMSVKIYVRQMCNNSIQIKKKYTLLPESPQSR